MSRIADDQERRRLYSEGRAEFMRLLETEARDEAGASGDPPPPGSGERPAARMASPTEDPVPAGGGADPEVEGRR